MKTIISIFICLFLVKSIYSQKINSIDFTYSNVYFVHGYQTESKHEALFFPIGASVLPAISITEKLMFSFGIDFNYRRKFYDYTKIFFNNYVEEKSYTVNQYLISVPVFIKYRIYTGSKLDINVNYGLSNHLKWEYNKKEFNLSDDKLIEKRYVGYILSSFIGVSAYYSLNDNILLFVASNIGVGIFESLTDQYSNITGNPFYASMSMGISIPVR